MAEVSYHTDDKGNPSNMRAMCTTSLVASMGCAIATFFTQDPNGLYLTTMFLVAAFAPKAIQKFAEIKMP